MKRRLLAAITAGALLLSAGSLCACGSGTAAAGQTEETAAAEEEAEAADAGSSDETAEEEESAAETAAADDTDAGETAEAEPSYDFYGFGQLLGDELTIKEVPSYSFISSYAGKIELGFPDEEEEIPYISLQNAVDVVNVIIMTLNEDGSGYPDPGLEISMDEDASTATITEANDSYVTFNYADNTMAISDVDSIDILTDTAGELAVISNTSTKNDVNYLIGDETKMQLSQIGYGFQADLLEDYGIPLYEQDGEVYVPLALINDIFLGMTFEIIYNGEAAFLVANALDSSQPDMEDNTMVDLFYSVEPGERSQALAEFSYGELCLKLNMLYGLKSTHGIEDFRDYLLAANLTEKLLSTDPEVFDSGIAELTCSCLNDQHSKYISNSAYAGEDYAEALNWDQEKDCGRYRLLQYYDELNEKRRSAGLLDENDQVINAYTEVGDTAYITFDSFAIPNADLRCYYNMVTEDGIDMEALEESYRNDTLGLVIYANQMINREGSPIKNVVIDLTANGGGTVDAAMYIGAWVLGSAQVNTRNQASGALYSYNYNADVDLDGVITENDSLDLDRLDVYCLESGFSFSCGNYVPAMFKASGKVTMIGQKSAGGSCAVQVTSAADGTMFRISSNYDLCLVKNGTFYSVDEGVEPDIYIKHMEKLYDRNWLTEYIDNIN